MWRTRDVRVNFSSKFSEAVVTIKSYSNDLNSSLEAKVHVQCKINWQRLRYCSLCSVLQIILQTETAFSPGQRRPLVATEAIKTQKQHQLEVFSLHCMATVWLMMLN